MRRRQPRAAAVRRRRGAGGARASLLSARLRRFYSVHKPGKLSETGAGSLEAVAAFYEGREGELDAILVGKYQVGLSSVGGAAEAAAAGGA